MSNVAPKKRVLIRSKGSKELRFSVAVPGYTAAATAAMDVPSVDEAPGSGSAASADLPEGVAKSSSSGPEPILVNTGRPQEPSVDDKENGTATAEGMKVPATEGAIHEVGSDQETVADLKPSKGRPPPVTMEAYIAQAYARKGQRVSMNAKLEKSLSTHHKLDEGATQRLMTLVQQDKQLLVPRQILLAAISIESHPLPKRVLVEFVQDAMLRHPIFGSDVCRQALDTAVAVPSVYSLLKSILGYAPLVRAGDEGPSASELDVLRQNALKLMLVWLFHSKGVRLEELSAALLQIVWKPAASELESDLQRLRVLTEISEPAAMGWVAEQYLKTATDAQDSEERIQREAVALRSDLTSARCELAVTTAIADGLRQELEKIKQDAAQAVTALEEDNQQTRTHLSHDIEVMRGRVVDGLRLNIERLETGLAALNRDVPRVAVMVERAEMVIESLKLELQELEGEE